MQLTEISFRSSPLAFMGSSRRQQQLEQTIYHKARALSRNYRPCEWRFFKCGRGSVFMAPGGVGRFEVAAGSAGVVSLSAEAFGLLVTAQTMQALSVRSDYRDLQLRAQALLAYAHSHREAGYTSGFPPFFPAVSPAQQAQTRPSTAWCLLPSV